MVKMFGLLWLLAAVEVLGTPYDITTWINFIGTIDGSLPLTKAANSKICYDFDVSQTCATTAIGTLLSQAAPDLDNWTPTINQCDILLYEQQIYAEKVATSLFSAAIASAADDSVPNFEILTQFWVLRVGYHALAVDHAAFVAALNGISDWTTVHCHEGNLLYDSATTPIPDFIGVADCDVLSSNPCANNNCAYGEAAACCMANRNSPCCNTFYQSLYDNDCSNNGCNYQSFCCQFVSDSPCCTGNS